MAVWTLTALTQPSLLPLTGTAAPLPPLLAERLLGLAGKFYPPQAVELSEASLV